MIGWFDRCWRTVWQSGWFSPGAIGALCPFPESWQGWSIFAGLIVALAATVPFHGEVTMLVRAALCLGYIAIGFVSFA